MPLAAKGVRPDPADVARAREDDLRFELREPNGPTEFDVFVESLEADQRPHAKTLWHMVCEHTEVETVTKDATWTDPDPVRRVRCKRCGLLFKLFPTKLATKTTEWAMYCPDGYDAFDWADLFTLDKSLWPFIHDVAEEEMLSDSMTKED